MTARDLVLVALGLAGTALLLWEMWLLDPALRRPVREARDWFMEVI